MAIESHQRENEDATGCIVHYSWTAPANANMVNIVHYLVVFNNTAHRVLTTENRVYEMEQPVCTCGSHKIAIFAVDHCGQTGHAKIHAVSSVSNVTCDDSTIDQTYP